MRYIYVIYNLVLSLQAELSEIYTGHDMRYIYVIYNLVLPLQAVLSEIYTGYDIYISYIIWYYPCKLSLPRFILDMI